MRVEVVKNSMARRAFADGPLQPLGDRLGGPCALVTGGTSIVEVAKTLVELAKELGDVELKEAIVGGEAELFSVEAVSKMKSKADLMGELGLLVTSPGRSLAGCLQAGGRIAGCLTTLAERQEAA
jgi:large subunit ribosomal protein L10